jgi:antitoxin HicB
MRYAITLIPDDNGTLLVTVPDVPEALTFGIDLTDAKLRAIDAIETALMGRMALRQEINQPSKQADVMVALPALSVAKIALYQAMQVKGMTKAELSRLLNCHPPQVDRLLDLGHASRLDQIEAALKALHLALDITVVAA